MALSYGFALQPSDNSADFSNALHSITGDGVAKQGGRFAFSVNGFTIALSSGYAYAAGRYLENDELHTMTIGPPSNSKDRVDALAVRVDYEARKAALEAIADVDPAEIQANPAVMRDDGQYVVFLYFIRVRRGGTSLTPDDVTDVRSETGLCEKVVPLSDIAGDVIYIYQFLDGGIDAEVARLIGLSNAVIARANAAILELDAAIKRAGGNTEIGELMTARRSPAGSGWLLCDGSAVPAAYPVLSALLSGKLPDISGAGDRYKTYIFGGEPALVASDYGTETPLQLDAR